MSHSTYLAPPTKEELAVRLKTAMQNGMKKYVEQGKLAAQRSRNMIYKSSLKDVVATGAGPMYMVTTDAFERTKGNLHVVDFSSLLKQAKHFDSGKKRELELLLKELESWPPTSVEMQRHLNRLTEEINTMLRNKEMDAEDVLDGVRGRIEIYIDQAKIQGVGRLEELYTEYYTLSDILSMPLNEADLAGYTLEELEYKINLMKEQVALLEHRANTAEIFQEIMEELGLEIEEFSTLDQIMSGEVYGLPDDPAVKVFISYQNDGFVFEPVVDVEEMNKEAHSPEEVQAAIRKPCELHKKIIDAAARKGLRLYLVNVETPSLQNVATTLDLTDRKMVERKLNRVITSNAENTVKQERRRRFTGHKERAVE